MGVNNLTQRHGAQTEARGARGQTALMWAVAQRHPSVVTVLLANGADVHARSDVWSQIMAVPPHGQPEYNREIPHGGNTALMFAARVGDVASAQHLLAAGADSDDTDAWGVSATTVAAHAGFDEIVQLLLEAGADPSAAEAGFAAIHAAVMRRDERMVATLLDHGADPSLASDWGLAPLYATIDAGYAQRTWYPPLSTDQEQINHIDLMKELIARGAEVNTRISKALWFRRFGGGGGDATGATAFWRAAQAKKATRERRPDLWTRYEGCAKPAPQGDNA